MLPRSVIMTGHPSALPRSTPAIPSGYAKWASIISNGKLRRSRRTKPSRDAAYRIPSSDFPNRGTLTKRGW